jgi:transcriptional regulator with XRE-family HTH domain
MAKKNQPTVKQKKRGPDPTVNQVFREAEEYGTKRFLDWKKSLWECQEQAAQQLVSSSFRLPSWMKNAREEVGFSQATLAQLSGLSAGAIANYESGYAVVPIDTAYEIYAVLFERKSEYAAIALAEIVSVLKTASKLVRDHTVKTIAKDTEYLTVMDSATQKFEEAEKGYKDFINAVRKAKGEK